MANTIKIADKNKKLADKFSRLLIRALPLSDNVGEAFQAVSLVMGYEKPAKKITTDVRLAWDIEDRRAQSVLNAAIAANRRLSAAARQRLSDILKLPQHERMGAVHAWATAYRTELATLLGRTQLAALLQGAREVAAKLPVVPPPGTVPGLPPTLPPEDSQALVSRLQSLPEGERAAAIYALPADQQAFASASLRLQATNVPPPPTFVLPQSPEGSGGEHFPIIDEAVRELSSKNVVTAPVFYEMDAQTRSKAFTIAAVESHDTLNKVQQALAENVQEGADYEAWRTKVLAVVDEGTFLSDRHMELVYRQAIQSAFSDGQVSVLRSPFVRTGFPYAGYFAIHDDRVRHNHLELESLGIEGTNIYRINDPVFQRFRPPWDWCDRCSWVPMTVQQAAEAGVQEAIEWLRTGIEPTPPAFVQPPPFSPPPGFDRGPMPLSLLSIDAFMGFDEGQHPRGQPENAGQFGSKQATDTGNSGKPLATPESDNATPEHPAHAATAEGEAKRQHFLKKYGAKIAEAADRIPIVGYVKQKMTQAMAAIHAKAAKRYGPRTAAAIMASGTVMDIALMAGGAALTGLPIVTGVNQLIGILPAFVLAEAKYQLQKAVAANLSLEYDEAAILSGLEAWWAERMGVPA